jgi:hypothetical protein
MTRRLASFLLVLAFARAADAHDAPIPPSDCVFETITVEAPASSLRADAVSAGPADTFRILFDTGGNVAQLQTGALPARALGGGMTGTITFRSLFDGRLRSNGELVADGVPLTLVLDGGSANVRVTLTTALAALGETAVEGSALAADGRFTLVGVTSSDQLLSGAAVVLRLSGHATPTPDLDGFVFTAITKRLAGKVAHGAVRVRAVIEVPVGLAPDFGDRRAAVRVSTGDTTLGSMILRSGLIANGRRFAGESDGVTISVSTLRKKPVLTLALDVVIAQPLATPSGGAPLNLTYDVGGLVARGSGSLRGR